MKKLVTYTAIIEFPEDWEFTETDVTDSQGNPWTFQFHTTSDVLTTKDKPETLDSTLHVEDINITNIGPFVLDTITVNSKDGPITLKFKEGPYTFNVEYNYLAKYYTIDDDAFGIHLVLRNPYALYNHLMYELQFIWNEYALWPDEKLSLDTQEYKQFLLSKLEIVV